MSGDPETHFGRGGIVPKASLLFAAVIFLAAGSFSPSFASKCYGFDPCEACRNCHACKHCHELGGKCGVCKRERNAVIRKYRVSKVPLVKSKGCRKASSLRTRGETI